MFANFLTITSMTCAESENTWTWTKPSAWHQPLCPAGMTAAAPCCMVLKLGACLGSRVQNCLARVVTRAGRFAPTTHHSHSLLWLPISFRIQFKILTLTYKTLSFGKPSYLANLIHLATPNRTLWFNKSPLLSAPNCNTKTGTRVFSICVPPLQNKLPLCIRSSESPTQFQQHLKTHLCGLAYPPWLVNFLISW